MSRIQATLQALQSARRKALIPYITTGDPFADGTPEVMHALVAGGADILELGVPFSDPMADGPVIQQASERALSRGIGSKQVLQAVREFRQRDTRTPVVLMGYANPIERYDGLLNEFLREKNLLLILGHCGHLVGACVQLATTILSACPEVRILAVSQRPLNIPEEQVI